MKLLCHHMTFIRRVKTQSIIMKPLKSSLTLRGGAINGVFVA